MSFIRAKFCNCYTNTFYLRKYLNLSILSIFINIFICNTCQYLNFCRKLLKCIKERENRNDILNSQVLLVTDHVRTSFNVKSCDIQQPMRYFKLLVNCYINNPQTDFWEKFNNVLQLQNEYMWSGTPAKVYARRIWQILKKNSIQIYLFWNVYCNTVESFVRPKIFKNFMFCMDELLEIVTQEQLCEANFCEHQDFISFNFINKLLLPTWIFSVKYYFEW